jgi:hypothetical protein
VSPTGSTARFDLGQQVDVGWLAGLPGIVPLRLAGQVFTAVVADPDEAVRTLRAAGLPGTRLLTDGQA